MNLDMRELALICVVVMPIENRAVVISGMKISAFSASWCRGVPVEDRVLTCDFSRHEPELSVEFPVDSGQDSVVVDGGQGDEGLSCQDNQLSLDYGVFGFD